MSNLVTQHPKYDQLYLTPQGHVVDRAEAEAMGFDVPTAAVQTILSDLDRDIRAGRAALPRNMAMSQKIAAKAEAKERERSDYIGSILALPEAQSRPIAAAKLASLYSEKSMPVAKAAIFLRSLPTEDGARVTINETEPSMSNALPAHTDAATFKRKIELRFAAMAQRADHGDLGAKSEAKRLGYAVKLINTTNMNPIAALQSAGVEPATIC